MNEPKSELQSCPICESSSIKYDFKISKKPYYQCKDCDFIFRNPEDLTDNIIDNETGHEKYTVNEPDATCKKQTIENYLKLISNYNGDSKGNLLIFGSENSFLKEKAEKNGFSVFHSTNLEESFILEKEHFFDVCFINNSIENQTNITETLNKIHQILKSSASLFIITSSLDNWLSRPEKHRFKLFNNLALSYFNAKTIDNILAKTSFHKVYISSDTHYATLKTIKSNPYLFQLNGALRLLLFFSVFLPFLNKKKCRVQSNDINVLATPKPKRERPLLSIILPVFNEVDNFPILIKLVLNKKLPGLDKEIIIIESNSTDGTREEVLKYKDHPEITLLLEDKPQGKGHAVRYGFEHAQGEFLLIQDSDLEYDVDDYDQLLAPLTNFRRAFILGSRHSKGWKMRHFEDQQSVSTFMNMGHLIFTWLVNLFTGEKLQDPFTMFKVFRTDCLYNIDFFSNRFDLDWEIVVKFIRKGYLPIELPVNYNSRSFEEGKKISLVADPIICIITLFKSRFSKLYQTQFDQ